MCMGNSHKHKTFKYNEAILVIFDTLDKKEKGSQGYQVPEVRMSNLHAVEEECNTHGREILARQLENNGTQGRGAREISRLTGPHPKPSYLSHLIQIRLRQHSKIPFLIQAFPSEALRQEGVKSKILSESCLRASLL